MKKLILIIMLAIVFAFSGKAMAEQPQITVGLKTWFATWETKLGSDKFESDYGVMYGPSVNVRYDKIFAGASYTLGSFSFPTVTTSVADVNLDADRSDLDLSAGYYFHPNVAGFIGYKVSDFDYNMTLDTIFGSSEATASETRNGPVLGVNGHYPIDGTRWVLFGNMSYVMLDAEYKDSTGKTTGDVTGPAIEFGGAYAAEMMPLSVSVGFKYQNYEYDNSGGATDTFSGLTFGVNYTIQ